MRGCPAGVEEVIVVYYNYSPYNTFTLSYGACFGVVKGIWTRPDAKPCQYGGSQRGNNDTYLQTATLFLRGICPSDGEKYS